MTTQAQVNAALTLAGHTGAALRLLARRLPATIRDLALTREDAAALQAFTASIPTTLSADDTANSLSAAA